MEYHDNDVTLTLGRTYTLVAASFRVDSFSVTEGQDPDHHIYDGLNVSCGTDGKLTFRVGRKGSGQVANWFNDRIPGSRTTFNHGADKLNFAMIGQLQLAITGGMLGAGKKTFIFAGVAFAQGHSGSSNNWWFGGEACSYVGNDQVSAEGTTTGQSAASFFFLRGGNDVSTVDVAVSKLVDTTAWMGLLDDGLTLDQVMMPGSHDAGMSDLSHCAPPIGTAPYTQTQEGSIGQQLVDGSRYFDIRVDYDYDQLVTYHRTDGWGCNGQAVKDLLDEARSFLAEHPSETAIFKVSHIREYDGHDPTSTKTKLNDLLDGYADVMFQGGTAATNIAKVTLGAARGMIIMVFDYSEHIDPATGRFRYADGASPQAGSNLTVYDQYSDTSDYNVMMLDQLKKWGQHGSLGNGFLFLLSWTLTASPPGATIRTLATEANDALPGVLYNQIVANGWGKPNIVYVDFIDNRVGQGIVLLNFM